MNEPILNSDDELLRRLLVRESGCELLPDDELEAWFDRSEIPSTSDEDQMRRILSKTRRLISDAAVTTVSTPAPTVSERPATGPTMRPLVASNRRHNHKSAVAVLLVSAIALVGVLVLTAHPTQNDMRVRGAYRHPILSAANRLRFERTLNQAAPVWLTADPRPETPGVTDGYVATATVVAAAERAGFKLAGSSEVNANPKDTKDHPFGVWTLPPNRRNTTQGKPADPAFDRARYDAIGESDRMTLRFVKR